MSFLIGAISFLLAGIGLGGGFLFIPLAERFLSLDTATARYFCMVAYIPAGLASTAINAKDVSEKTVYLSLFSLIGVGIGHVLGRKFSFLEIIYNLMLIAFGIEMILSALKSIRKNKNFCEF